MPYQTDTTANAHWDAGDAGCTRLITGLRGRIDSLSPGESLKVVAVNPSARIDLWVWCRMTGHRLISEAHPTYLIQRRHG